MGGVVIVVGSVSSNIVMFGNQHSVVVEIQQGIWAFQRIVMRKGGGYQPHGAGSVCAVQFFFALICGWVGKNGIPAGNRLRRPEAAAFYKLFGVVVFQ